MDGWDPTDFKPEGPQPLVRDIPPGQPYPVDALGPLKRAVEAVQGQTLAPLAIAAQSALSVSALAVQGFANVETLGGARPVSLYCLTIAQSGERKSSCDAPLMAALVDYERDQNAAQRAEMDTWRNALSLWKGSREQILTEAKKAKGEKQTASQADLDALGSKPTAPPAPDRVVTEPTYEGLTRLFAEGMPSLGIFSDEGGQFLGGHAMSSENRQKTLTALNKLWDGSSIKRTRQGDGFFTLYHRRLSVHLMVQPGVARAFMADPSAADTGFLPRFLITEPPSTIGGRFQAMTTVDAEGLDGFSATLQRILSKPMPMDAETRELDVRVLPLSPEAKQLVAEFADSIEAQCSKGGKLAGLTGAASKAPEQACRIAGVLTLWGDLNAPCVSLEMMENGIELANYYLSEALRLSEAAVVSSMVERAESLRVWLSDNWPAIAERDGRSSETIVPRDVVQSGPRSLRETGTAKQAMGLLVSHGWLVPLPEGATVDGKSRKVAYQIERADDVL